MEWDPLDMVAKDEAWGHKQLGEIVDVDTLLVAAREVDAAVLKQVDWVLGVHVFSVKGER